MAQINHSQSFTQLFLPPEGYQTDFVELTTFTLSLRLLLRIPLLIHCGDQRMEFPRHLNTAIKREEYRNCCNKFHIYYDGATKAAVDDPSFYSTKQGQLAQYLKSACCTALNVPNGLFHPKIMVFQFSESNRPEKKRFRVHLSSRNLTMSGYLEAGVTLESSEHGSSLEAVADFFEILQGKNKQGIDWETFRKNTFVLLVGSEATAIPKFSLHFGGPPQYTGSKQRETLLELIQKDLEKYDSIRITSINPNPSLFSGKKVEYVCNFKDLYEEDSDRPGVWRKKDEWRERASAYLYPVVKKGNNTQKEEPNRPRDLHIKQYILCRGKNAGGSSSIWIGSANCSEHALKGTNIEVLLHYCLDTAENCKALQKGSDFCILKTENNQAVGDEKRVGLTGRLEGKSKLTYGTERTIKDPILPPITEDEERFLRLQVKDISYEEIEEGRGILRVIVCNCESDPVEIKLPRGTKSLWIGGKQVQKAAFPVTKKHFANLLLAKKKDDIPWYTIPLSLSWEGYDLKTLTDRLPLDPMESVRELVPVVKGTGNPNDEAYERLIKWVVKHPDNGRMCLENILREIDLRQAEYYAYAAAEAEEDEDEDEDDVRQMYFSVQSTYRFRKDLALLRELTEEMLGRENLI